MSPLTLLLIVLFALLVLLALVIFNHRISQRMINAQAGMVIRIEKLKEKPKEPENPPPVEEEAEKQASKPRERTHLEIKPSEEAIIIPAEKNHKAENRRKLRRNMMKSEIWNRIWS
jgi:hypothetical protein